MSITPNIGLTNLEDAQNQKHLTVNKNMAIIDALLNTNVTSVLTTPPGSPSEGDVYLIADSGATGAWTGKEDNITIFIGNAWQFFSPYYGWKIVNIATQQLLMYNGTAWELLFDAIGALAQNIAGNITTLQLARTNNTAKLLVRQNHEIVNMSGIRPNSTISFPNKTIPLFASVLVKTAITGPSGFQWFCFDTGTYSHSFETGYTGNTALNTKMEGPSNPIKPVYTDGRIFFEDMASTPGAGAGVAFTGGQVRVTLQYLVAEASTS